MRWLLAIAVVAWTVTARAEQAVPLPTIESEIAPTIRIAARVSDLSVERGEITWVSFAMPPRHDLDIPLDVPTGTLVVGLQVDTEASEPVWGEPGKALGDEAGAMVSRASASGGEDHLVLRHAPRNCGASDVVMHCREWITLALAFPTAVDRVEIWPAPSTVDKKPWHGARVPITQHALATDAQAVSAETSLVARTQPRFTFRFCCARPLFVRELDKHMIRRRIQLRREALRHCYELSLQQHWQLAGNVTVHFHIRLDGSVDDVSVDGTLDDEAARTCIANEASAWQFPESDVGTVVNYPIAFESM